MTGWVVDLRPRPEPRFAAGVHPACAVTVFLASFGFAVSVGSLLVG